MEMPTTMCNCINACRNQETDNLQTEIIRNRILQYNEPSSRRGSVGDTYYTRKYSRTTSIRSDDQINNSLPAKRLSIPACDQSSKPAAVVTLSSSPVDTTDVTRHRHHVIPSCDTSNIPNQQISIASTSSINIKPVVQISNFPINTNQNEKTEEKNNEISFVNIETKPKLSEVVESELSLSSSSSSSSSSTNELTRLHEDDVCDDRTPLLTSELASTIKDSSNHTTRKYSFNALLPLVRPSNSHPLCSSLTSTNADGGNSSNGNGVDVKPRHRASLSSALRRSSFAKQPTTFCSTIDSTNTTRSISSSTHPIESDTSDQTSLLSNKSNSLNNQQHKKSLNRTSIETTSYQKDFMQKIERFRFIDDSASSTTTVTSPVESIEHVNTRQTTCNHLITSTIEQIDDFVRKKYDINDNNDDDDVNSLIDCINSNTLTNGSYSDLNILNNTSSTKTILRPQTFKPVNNKSFQLMKSLSGCQQHNYHQSTPINIPHSMTSLPLSKQQINGYSRSMDFQSLTNKHDLIRPITIISTINETSSSSSTATLTSLRNSSSLEFDDNIKPSGVLVDDDFLPMSSPVDEHFWNMNIKNFHGFNNNNNNNNKCFPDVGSSPDIEVKHFDLQQFNTLSETSCDEDDDDDDDDSSTSTDQLEISPLHEYKIDKMEKSLVLIKSNSPIQKISEEEIVDKSLTNPSISSTEQFNINSSSIPISSHQPNNESLLEKFSLSSQIPIPSDFLCDTILSSLNQHSQTISEEDDTQDSSTNDASEGDESADNGEIDLVQEFELSQREQQNKTNNFWTTNDRDVYIIQDDDVLSALVTTPTVVNRNTQPTSIMKITNNKISDNIDEQQQTLKPKVRFNLDPQYEREREWNKVNKLLGNSVEWTDEFEV
ncbi:unnamed protein product [Rotaria sordida]|uniref:Uncharacterized protein n=1 Tax=Rotaria sordida TaxID=392033 RepID=A0A814VG97_9BILA|nr:unnamed protein product [Rotaria sordida]